MTSKSIRDSIEESRKELLDLSFRNPLLNYRSLRARGVEIVGESSDQVFETLVTDGKPMSFLARQEDDDSDTESWETGLPTYLAANQTDRRLQTGESSANLQKRLLTTYRFANTTIEETGVNTLFLALGMLRWYEADQSEQERLSPLILIPVRLERQGVREQFRVEYNGEDLGTNLSLIEKARSDFGISLPGPDEIEQVAEGTIGISDYFDLVAERVRQSGLERWIVDPDSIALGFFAYNKLLMYQDLDVAAWPKGERIEDNEIVLALYRDGFSEPAQSIPDDAHLDNHLRPQDTYHVLDADSSQSLAILDAIAGRNMIIQGPPGTGKSQTITNIIAEAVGRGKRVLFVAEKMAALEVVKRRLDNIGLGDTCLELHSHKTNKRETLAELGRVLGLKSPATDSMEIEDTLSNLLRTRNQLNDYATAVNTPVGASGVTPNDAFGKLLTSGLAANESPNPISWPHVNGISNWTGADFTRKKEVVEDLRLRLQSVGAVRQHPFLGCSLRNLLPTPQASLRENIEAATNALETLTDLSDSLARELNLECPVDATKVDTLLNTAKHVAEVPNLSGLNLTAQLWQSHPKQIAELMEIGLAWQQMHSKHESSLLPQAWDADLSQVRHVLNTKGRSFFGRLFSSSYRQARSELAALLTGELPRDVDHQIALIDAISQEQQLRANLRFDQSGGKYRDAASALGSHWAGHNTDWTTVEPITRWWLNLQDGVVHDRVPLDAVRVLQAWPDAGRWTNIPTKIDQISHALSRYLDCVGELLSVLDMDEQKRFGDPGGLITLSFLEQRRVLNEWAARLPEIQDVIGFNNGADAASAEGLGPVVMVAEQRPDAAVSLTSWFERAWYESVVETAFAERPTLRDFDSQVHESRIERFKELDRQSQLDNVTRVTMTHMEGPSQLNDMPQRLNRVSTYDSDSETTQRRWQEQLRFLRREIAKRSRHKPIRQLVQQSGEIIQELKPVFMMSPLSIATYLAPGSVKFDLLIFDEASQVRPVDAFGALLRTQKAVVVGDSRQLPPTSFFDRAAHSDDSDDQSETADIESILGLFNSKGAPERHLHWHYRSRHESLIAVSNREFYDNRLMVFPSPHTDREAIGLRLHYLPNAMYDRGRSGVNRVEAEAVAQAVMEHATRSPELTLGVAAFGVRQAEAIQDEVELLRRMDDSREAFFASHPDEPFFVKNLENVQGDERDVIFISIGYGHDETGQVSMNFGPLNSDGGERRLNVLITRAKQQCHVFTNLHSDDVDLGRSQAFGVRALKTFLAYAETGVMPKDVPHESDFVVDSPFQQAVAARLKQRGYSVDQEVAAGGKFIDIGILDPERPGRYIIGIECDGATYHSPRSARDRDRLREQVLRGLGWKLHRIWSTDWFRNPERELQRAIEAIEEAKATS